MAQFPVLEDRINRVLLAEGLLPEPKKMFGGVAFMVNGHMCVGITNKGDFMVRVAPERYDAMLEEPGVRVMEFTGRPMKGFLFVEPEAVNDQKGLAKWVWLSLEHVRILPPKVAKKAAARKKKG